MPSTPPLVAWIPAARGDLPALPALLRSLAAATVQESTRIEVLAAPEDVTGARAIVEAGAREAGLRAPVSVAAAAASVTASLREALARHPGADIAILSPRTALPFAWDARLAKAAHAAPRIGAAVPMCDLSPTFELFDEATRRSLTIDPVVADRAAFCLGDRGYYEVPRLHAACAYLRRDALEEALPDVGIEAPSAGVLVDALYRPLRSRGWTPVLCDYIYLTHGGEKPAAGLTPDEWEEGAYRDRHPLTLLRRYAREAISKGLPMPAPGLDARPVQLHVMHYWGGGLDKWVRDFSRADSRSNLLFATMGTGEHQGQRIVLFGDSDATIPLRTWDIARPIRSTAVASVEYRRILEQVVREFSVDAVIVSSLIGHSLEALDTGLPTLVVCHDFYPICQAINPWFGRGCRSCDAAELARCAADNPLNRIFTDQTTAEWDRLRSRYVDLLEGKRLVVPSPSVATTLRALAPRLAGADIRVIPHGIEFSSPKVPPQRHEAGERLRLVVLGRLNPQKGLDLLREAAPGLSEHAEVTLLGCDKPGTELAAAAGWRSIERYDPKELAAILQSLAPHAGLLVSVIPETFSYTLSELVALGIPPVATAHGSFADRIVEGESGFLFEPEAAALVARIKRLREDPAAITRVAERLAAQPAVRSTRDMVEDYHAVLPLADRPVARFAVGVGRHDGTSEPYRHLQEAYEELRRAYEQVARAYAHAQEAYEASRAAYDHTRGAWEVAEARLARIQAEMQAFSAEWRALGLPGKFWLAPRAVDLTRRFQLKIRDLALPEPEEAPARADPTP